MRGCEMEAGREGSSESLSDSDDLRALLESAERIAQIGSWERTSETGELHWSDNAIRLLGLEPGSVPPSPGQVLEITHPGDRDRQAREVESIRRGTMYQRLDYRVIRADGEVRYLVSTPVALTDLDDFHGREGGAVGADPVPQRPISAIWPVFRRGSTALRYQEGGPLVRYHEWSTSRRVGTADPERL